MDIVAMKLEIQVETIGLSVWLLLVKGGIITTTRNLDLPSTVLLGGSLI